MIKEETICCIEIKMNNYSLELIDNLVDVIHKQSNDIEFLQFYLIYKTICPRSDTDS